MPSLSVKPLSIVLTGLVITLCSYWSTADEVTIKGSQRHFLTSKTIPGQIFEIDISLPRQYIATKKYPTIYIIDAETNFGATSYIAHRLMKNKDIPEVLLVGIAYNTSYKDFYKKRLRDLTPLDRLNKKQSMGGAKRFVQFLQQELFPFIEKKYSVQPNDRTLYGHSFGGLFAFYVFFAHNDLFKRLIAISPSIWWSDRYLLSLEEKTPAGSLLSDHVLYTAVGSEEVFHNGPPNYFINDWKTLVKRLQSKKFKKLHMKADFLEGENHRSIFGTAYTRGLRFVFSK